jgi:hypothetical protein
LKIGWKKRSSTPKIGQEVAILRFMDSGLFYDENHGAVAQQIGMHILVVEALLILEGVSMEAAFSIVG